MSDILIAGVGGQGIILAARVIAECAGDSGLEVRESEVHGMAQRGGSVNCHVRFGPRVHAPLIPSGQADILLALEELEALRQLPFLAPRGLALVNERRIYPGGPGAPAGNYPADPVGEIRRAGFEAQVVPAWEIAGQAGNRKVENVVMLGALSRHLTFEPETWRKAISRLVSPALLETNLDAFERGVQAVPGPGK